MNLRVYFVRRVLAESFIYEPPTGPLTTGTMQSPLLEVIVMHSYPGRHRISNRSLTINLIFLFLIALAGNLPQICAQSVPPAFDLDFLGNGSPSAINNAGTVVGVRTTGSVYEPLVSSGGEPWLTLPVPAGSMSTFPTDINNSGVIVGVSFSPQWNPVAVRWTRGTSGYTLEILPRIANDPSSYATAINDLGQIIGARRTLEYQPTGTGWIYSDTAGFTDLTTLGFWIVPRDLNNAGFIIGGQERLNLATGQVDVIGQGPANYNAITGVAINASGMIAGASSLRSTSLNIVSVFRYVPGGGWTFIDGSSRYTTASSINSLGDIGYGELGAGIYLDGLGTFAVGNLLDSAVRTAGWTITGNGTLVNDLRAVATVGRNTITGETGAVLLTPIGALPTPTAPTDLNGVPHPATRMEPFNSIDLTWVNTSSLTRGYELQRVVQGLTDWTTLALTPPGTAANHRDTTVGVNVTYNYRVRATGLGGASPWSNVVTVTSPAIPLDTTPPTVVLLEPVDGANVSGIVPVRARATDNVAVEYQEISFWNQFTGQQVVIGSAASGGDLNVNWDTNALAQATYRLRSYAYDTLGNWNQVEVNVNVGTGIPLMRVSNIELTAIGRTVVYVTGLVFVRDAAGNAVPGATVDVSWRTPKGRIETQTAQTDSRGAAVFTVRSIRGTYRLTVTNVAKTGYRFDTAGSQLTATISR